MLSATTAAQSSKSEAGNGHGSSHTPEKSSSSVTDSTVRARKATDKEREPGEGFEVGKATEPMPDPTKRDTGPDLAALAAEINADYHRAEGATGRAKAANQESVEHAIRAGEKLIRAKAEVGHRNWMNWTKDNFDGSHSTAVTYMKLANRKADSQRLANLGLGIAAVASALVTRRQPKPQQTVTDWAAGRGKILHRAVRDALNVAAIIDHAIGLAPKADRERMAAERDVMTREIRDFLDHPWPVTPEPATPLFDHEESAA